MKIESAESPSGIQVTLNDQKVWKAFWPNTEMIVTKKKGRVIFPHLGYNIKGLKPSTLYQIFISLQRIDGIKMKFDAGKWQEFGKGDPLLPIQQREHPDGARPGSHWMSNPVSFSHLKITNDPENIDQKLICVQSMHKYIPVITIKEVGYFHEEEFRIKLTEFVVVTAYQSEEMIKLKVAHNKFASGFRSNGKRKNSFDSDDTSPKQRSPSSDSSSYTSPPPPISWEQPRNPFSPIQFNQQNAVTPPPFSMQNQFPDFSNVNPYPQFYFNPMYPGMPFEYNQMYMNMGQMKNESMNFNHVQNSFNGV